MSNISRVDMFDAALGAANTAVQAWGVTQQQRRTAEYNKALADAREGYRVLLQDIEKENDYTQHEVMFNRGVSEIRKTVGDQWLSDPYVRNRFDEQWTGMTQAARGTAMNYSWAAEKSALQVEMFNQIQGFYQSSLENAYANTQGIINQYYEAGIIDDVVREKAWEYYRQQGKAALETRVDAAVEARDNERVRSLYETAIASDIFEDPKLANDLMKAAQYEISVGWAEDVALAQYRRNGVDAAIAWLQDPDNEAMGMLELEDQARVTRFVREQIGFQRSEEELAARKADEAFMSRSVDIETQIREGESTWEAGLAWLRGDEAREALRPGNWRGLYDRWQQEAIFAAREAAGAEGPQPREGESKDQFMVQFYRDVYRGADEAELRERALNAWDRSLISRTDFEFLMDKNVNREEAEAQASWVETMVRDVIGQERLAGSKAVENIDFLVDKLEGQIFANMQRLTTAPDGTQYTQAEQEANIRNMIMARLRAEDLTDTRFFGLIKADMSDQQVLERAQEKQLYSLIPRQAMQEAMRGILNKEGDELNEYLYSLMFPNTPEENLYALERNQVEAFKRMAVINNNAKDAFVEEFGIQPERTGVGVDGIAYFSRIEPDPDNPSEYVERPYRREIRDGEYVWTAYHRVGGRDTWTPFDPEKERRDAAEAEARRAAYREARESQAEAVARMQPELKPETIGTQAEGTPYADVAIDTAEGQPNANPHHHATVLLLAQPMTDLRDIRLSLSERLVYDRVHRALSSPTGAITQSDFDEILSIVNHYLFDWQGDLEDRERAIDFRNQLQTPGGNR